MVRSFLWLSRSLELCIRGKYRDELSSSGVVFGCDEVAHRGALMCPFKGEKVTTIGWAMALMTTFEGPGRSKGYKGRKSSPSLRGPFTVCAAQRMVGRMFFCAIVLFLVQILFIIKPSRSVMLS